MSRRTEQILLLLILLLAAILRMGWPGVSEFKLDEARLSLLALEMARGKSLPLHGITSSVGLPNPPISVYLFALPYFLSPDPILATMFVGLLNVIAVGLTWWLARRTFGAWVGLLAALLYAASPWGVIYSRKIWAQDLLPPFVLLTVITGLAGFVEEAQGPWKRQIAHLVLLVLTVQIHYSAVSLIPLTLVMLAIGRRRLDRRFWLGVVLAALTLVPFALAALQGGWLERIGNLSGGRALTLSAEALDHAHLITAGTEIHALAGPDAFGVYLASAPNVWPLLALVGWAALLAALWLIVSGLRPQSFPEARQLPGSYPRLILGLWVFLPILTFTVTWTPSYPHYMIPLIPAACIALAAGCKALVGVVPRWGSARAAKAVFTALVVVIAAAQAYVTLALLAFLDTHHTPGGFGTPLHYLLDVRDAARAMAEDDEILLVSENDDPHAGQDPAVWRSLLYDHAPGVRLVDGRATLVYPAEPALALLTPALSPDAAAARYPPPAAEAPLREPSEGAYRLTPLRAQPGMWPGEPVEALLANGVSLRTWRFADTRFWLTWQVSQSEPDRGLKPPVQPPAYTLFVHLLDGDGNRVAQADVPAWRGPWREGDVIVTRFDLGAGVAIPEGGTWRIGMYDFLEDGSTRGVDVLDAAGNPAGWWVDLPVGNKD